MSTTLKTTLGNFFYIQLIFSINCPLPVLGVSRDATTCEKPELRLGSSANDGQLDKIDIQYATMR